MLSKLLEFSKTRLAGAFGEARAKQSEIVLGIAVVLIAIIAFKSGQISTFRQLNEPLKIKYAPAVINNKPSSPQTSPSINQSLQKLDLRVIASKNSSLYHFLWCSGAQRIKEGNKITFASEEEAQSRGYKIASNCTK